MLLKRFIGHGSLINKSHENQLMFLLHCFKKNNSKNKGTIKKVPLLMI